MVKRLVRKGKSVFRKGRNALKKSSRLDYKKEKMLLVREQTLLAKERTVLSFMRTGMASIGAGIVIMNIFPTVSAQVISWAFIISGIVEIMESYRRLRHYQRSMDRINHELGDWPGKI